MKISKIRKIIVLAAAAFLLSFSVCACGNSGSSGSGDPAVKAEESSVSDPAKSQAGEAQKTEEVQADADEQKSVDSQAKTDGQKTEEEPADTDDQGTPEELADTDDQGTPEEPADPGQGTSGAQADAETAVPAEPEPEPAETAAPSLLYMGQGSLRIVTGEDKVIYIDPYSGDGYDLPADLILVTHGHFDHNQLDLVQNRNEDCRIITQAEALAGGEHQVFQLGYVTVEAVEAGYNQNHDVNSCVGYILTFSNERSVYVTGDTSTTPQMPLLAEKEIDYAFFCCDGVYNMDAAEASKCAEMVAAKHNLPYHTSAKNDGYNFDRDVAEQFEADNRIILAPGEEIAVE